MHLLQNFLWLQMQASKAPHPHPPHPQTLQTTPSPLQNVHILC